MNDVCQYSGVCSGCEWIQKPYHQQVELKKDHLKNVWLEANLPSKALEGLEFLKISPFQSRDRADLIIKRHNEQRTVGLYDRTRKLLIDIERCPQMSAPLQAWYYEFRKTIPDINIGSFRLRVSPRGIRGVWLDLPNLEIKEQLQKEWFRTLLEFGVVEVGQKRKRLKIKDGELRLGDPELNPWFQTYTHDDLRPVDIYGPVGGFTQPGFDSNKILISRAISYAKKSGTKDWLELGSGSGNFTFPLSSLGGKVVAVEMDELALTGIETTVSKNGWKSRIEIKNLNFHKRTPQLKTLIESAQALLVDPPRSGLQGTLDCFDESKRLPGTILYVSCFPESFVQDCHRLYTRGYSLRDISIVDQFPQSPHYEIVAHLTLT